MDLARLLQAAGVQTHDAWEWLFVLAPILVLAEVVFLVRSRRIEVSWEDALVFLVRGSLAVAFVGFVWDVDWHADLGRDSLLFTVPHVLILMGLSGIGLGALAAIVIPKQRAGVRIGRFDAPFSAIATGALATGALIGFPLDDLWHKTYGIDVTMWSPTHLLMIGGASLAPLALWLAFREGAGKVPGGIARWTMGGIVLVGLSTFQLEYDAGVVQWQLLLQPMLIAGAAAIALVAARAAGGRGAALTSVATFWVIRGVIDLLLGPGLHRGVPAIPLYLGEAIAIEAAFLLLPRLGPVVLGAVAGGAAAILGTATEWPWTHLWYALPWQPSMLPYLWEAVAVGVAGGVVGMAIGGVIGRAPGPSWRAVTVALLAIAGLFAIHLPFRHAEPATVTVRSVAAGGGDRVSVSLSVAPASAVQGADFFDVVAWQGGAVEHFELRQTAPGQFATVGSVPVFGHWKSLVMLGRGDVLEAVPVEMPADPSYGLPAIPPPAERQEQFVPASRLLMREAHGGTPLPALLAGTFFALFLVLWPMILGLAYRFTAEGRHLELRLPKWAPAAVRRRPAIR